MRKISMIAMAVLMFMGSGVMAQKAKTYIPWENGKLQVSDEGRYLRHENGTPFFWLGETGWLMPERLNRDEVNYYLQKCKEAGICISCNMCNALSGYSYIMCSAFTSGGNKVCKVSFFCLHPVRSMLSITIQFITLFFLIVIMSFIYNGSKCRYYI